ncbi:AroM family protein [Sporomusa aerivorans]|uniref:AroM family protein n=1 Tax=Sporomusa aerivorans TaxID=204936 RepID=UPI00352AF683
MKKVQTVACVSIGQSPRTDVTSDLKKVWGNTFNILDIGALDDLSHEEITSLAPVPGESDLITKLRNGQAVYLSHHRLIPHIEQALEKSCSGGADWAIVLCTGDFSHLKSSLPYLLPNPVLAHSVESILKPDDKLTVIVPTQGQVTEATARWSERGFEVSKVIVESPFANHQGLFKALKNDPALQKTQGLIADCFGFDIAFMNSVAEFYDKPIFISRKLISHLLLAIQ